MPEIRPVSILATGSYLPPDILTNVDLEKMVDTTDEWITTRTGIKQRHILRDADKCTSDIGYEAGKRCLEAAGCAPDQVDLVICCTYTPDYVFPATACLIQKKLGLTRAGAFDMEVACSGFLYGLTVGAQFIACGTMNRVLVIGAELNTRILDWKDRSTCVIFGDGASAALLGPGREGGEILSSYLGADGNGANFIIQHAGGTRHVTSPETIEKNMHTIHMEGKETFKMAVRWMADASLEALKRANLQLSDLNLLIPHQANIRIIEAAAKRLDVPMEKCLVNIDRVGNTAAASLGIALDEALRTDRIKPGDNSVLVVFGGGLTWGSSAIHWHKVPKQ